jgi:glutamine amidotransferase
MCRILAIQAGSPVDVEPLVRAFADRCKESKEFQGDGWGVSWREGGGWRSWHSLEPIWASEPPTLPASRLFLVHARSAFRNERIAVDNNMPFVDEGVAFAFNGELRGVRLQAPGDTGAWRLFHLFRRFRVSGAGREEGVEADADTGLAALRRLDRVIRSRTDYVRALNLVVSDGERVWINSRFSEDPDYFTLWRTTFAHHGAALCVVSSERFDVEPRSEPAWRPLSNGVTETLTESALCSS